MALELIIIKFHILKYMTQSLNKAGFTVDLLEYWDEAGSFNFNSYNENYGEVMRSSKHDKSNVSGKLEYTSLIVDAVKV